MNIFYPIFISDEIIITYGVHPFNICLKNPLLWKYIKIVFIFTYVFSNFIFSNFIFNQFLVKFFVKKDKKSSGSKVLGSNLSKLNLLVGKFNNEDVFIPEKGLYQNFLITGTIGSGKTSSAMYPFTKQLLKYNSENSSDKVGMLILDVKGNYYNQVKNYVDLYGLQDDLVVIGLNSGIFYNPLHKPNLKPIVLANRLKTILTLFSENNSESYWLDKAEQILAEAIKLCRLYNDNYVTFSELHKLITVPGYYKDKIDVLKA